MVEQVNKAQYSVLTSANIVLYIDDVALGGVNMLDVEDCQKEGLTRVTLQLAVFNNQDIVENMRRGKFLFRIMNSTTNNGWIGSNCDLEKFHMSLSASDPAGILTQMLVFSTGLFTYHSDVRPALIGSKEKEDYDNLVAILKKNQEASTKNKTIVVLPTVNPMSDIKDDEIVWCNVKKPEQVIDSVKPRKLKKKIKNTEG